MTPKSLCVKTCGLIIEEGNMRALSLAGLIALTLAACSGRGPDPIRDFGAATISQFEREVVTQNELTLPPTFNVLPQPILGAPNRADP